MTEQLWRHIRIEQVAFHAGTVQEALIITQSIGGSWKVDVVTARIKVLFGNKIDATNEATLLFNYDFIPGRELEVIRYMAGPNWLSSKTSPCLSHLGTHVKDFEPVKKIMKDGGVGIAQEVVTLHHTNPAIPKGHFYHYLIFDSHHILGFDLKLIKRITA